MMSCFLLFEEVSVKSKWNYDWVSLIGRAFFQPCEPMKSIEVWTFWNPFISRPIVTTNIGQWYSSAHSARKLLFWVLGETAFAGQNIWWILRNIWAVVSPPQVSRVKLECTVTVHIKVDAAWSLVRTREELKTKPLQRLRKAAGDGWGGGYCSRYPPTQW